MSIKPTNAALIRRITAAKADGRVTKAEARKIASTARAGGVTASERKLLNKLASSRKDTFEAGAKLVLSLTARKPSASKPAFAPLVGKGANEIGRAAPKAPSHPASTVGTAAHETGHLDRSSVPPAAAGLHEAAHSKPPKNNPIRDLVPDRFKALFDKTSASSTSSTSPGPQRDPNVDAQGFPTMPTPPTDPNDLAANNNYLIKMGEFQRGVKMRQTWNEAQMVSQRGVPLGLEFPKERHDLNDWRSFDKAIFKLEQFTKECLEYQAKQGMAPMR